MDKLKTCKYSKCKNEIPKGLRSYCSKRCQELEKKARDKKKKWVKQRGVTTKKLDALWSKLVRERDGKCMYCGSTENLNAHHIFSRSNYSTRWDLDNGICLCSGCHTFSSKFSAHKTPCEFTYWLEGLKGREFIDKLRLKAHEVNDRSKEEWWADLTDGRK